MAYEEMAMQIDAGDGAVGPGMLNGGGGGLPGGAAMGGGPQDDVGAVIEARAQIDARLEQLGVPVAMLNADAGGVPGGMPGPGVGPDMGMPPPMPPAGLLG